MEFRFPEGAAHGGRLSYVGPVPVLVVGGEPEEIAEQVVALALRPAAQVLDYPLALVAMQLRSRWLARLVIRALDRLGRRLVPRFPEPHRRELLAMARTLGDERVVRGNTLFDLKNLQPWRLFGCSSLGVEPDRSLTGGPLLARNMDFFPLGSLHEFGLVTAHRPARDRMGFLSIGYPGAVGCFSGINEAGLAVVSHEVFGSPGRGFDPRGVPFASIIRRALETCSTTHAAEALVRATPRATSVSLVLCDVNGPAALEVTPGAVVRRAPHCGACVCTNHFTGPGLASNRPANVFATVTRHRTLEQLASAGARIGPADAWSALHAVHQGELTLQSMVFEPMARAVSVALGVGPATALTPTRLSLPELIA
jgi:hypothetical protein